MHKLLRHAHIARLFEVISSQASIACACSTPPAARLRELLDQHGALPEARARRYLRQICGALHYCHEVVHVVHRDIKLDNMLLDADDNVLLADFGFAEVVGPSKRKLRLLCGSPHYSAPEIFAQQEYVGSQADMWSLGVLAYTLLAGHFPFQADTMDALGKKVRHGRWDARCRRRPRRPSSSPRSSSSARRSARRSPPSATTAGCSTAPPPPPTSALRGRPAARWDDAAAAELDAMGCSAALVRHHVQAGAHNHVTAAFDLVAAGASGGAVRCMVFFRALSDGRPPFWVVQIALFWHGRRLSSIASARRAPLPAMAAAFAFTPRRPRAVAPGSKSVNGASAGEPHAGAPAGSRTRRRGRAGRRAAR